MTRRTYERDAEFIDEADDIEYLVFDKRACWRSNPAKASRRQRRYKKKILNELFILQKN